MSLTRRQKEILDFIQEFLRDNGYSPTLEEIAHRFRMASLNGVYKHLKALEERGRISRLANQARSIQVRQEKRGAGARLPLFGYIAAGQPLEALPNHEEISVPDQMLTRGNNYVLRVRGDSMIEEHIQDGDYVVVEHREEARNGEMVVALVDGERATLKKFYRENGRIRLQPANSSLEPLVLSPDRVRIQGVVVGIMRRY